MQNHSFILSGPELIEKLKEGIPSRAFQPRPIRGYLVFPLVAVIVVGTWAIMSHSLPWYGALLVSFLVGMTYGSLAFLAHETLHGSTLKSRWAQDFVGYCGFFIYGLTPTLWRVWHNQVHHTMTNIPDLDPDSYGTLERFKKIPLARFQFKTGIGSGSFLSVFFYLYRFTYHSQIVLWVISKKYKNEFRRLKRKRAIMESLFIAAFWITLGVIGGLQGALLGVLVPMMIANFTIMSYISTNHFLRPLTDEDEPVDHSMSLMVSKWIDLIHLQFSHHVEHHYFPSMNPHYAPLIRKNLIKYTRNRYLAPPYWKTILWLYRTPRVYENATTLINPYTGYRVKIKDVEAKLRKGAGGKNKETNAPRGLAIVH